MAEQMRSISSIDGSPLVVTFQGNVMLNSTFVLYQFVLVLLVVWGSHSSNCFSLICSCEFKLFNVELH